VSFLMRYKPVTVLSPGVKQPKREDDSPPSSTGVNYAWSYSSIHQYVFVAWCLIKQWIRLHSRNALGYGPNDQGLESRQGLGIFLFTAAFRPALRPTQPSVQWVVWVKRLGRETDHSPRPVFKSRMRGAIPLLPNTPS
jgi:hypothetical protein